MSLLLTISGAQSVFIYCKWHFTLHMNPAAQQRPLQVRRETVVLHLAQVEESASTPEGVQTPVGGAPDVTSAQEDPRPTATPPPSIIPSRGTESGRASGHDSPADPQESPHKEFHSAVLKALGCDAEPERDGPPAGTCGRPLLLGRVLTLLGSFFLPVSCCFKPW